MAFFTVQLLRKQQVAGSIPATGSTPPQKPFFLAESSDALFLWTLDWCPNPKAFKWWREMVSSAASNGISPGLGLPPIYPPKVSFRLSTPCLNSPLTP